MDNAKIKKWAAKKKILTKILFNSKGGAHFAVFVRLKRGRVQLALKIEIEA